MLLVRPKHNESCLVWNGAPRSCYTRGVTSLRRDCMENSTGEGQTETQRNGEQRGWGRIMCACVTPHKEK